MQGPASACGATAAVARRFLLVLDFEATCEDGDRSWRNEVIEFPVVAMEVVESCTSASGVTLRPAGEFREFVRPTEVPALTAFCTSLTGIAQADVGGAQALPEVMKSFGRWLGRELGLAPGDSVLLVTCGDWDLQTCLPRELKRKGLPPPPPPLDRWCNLKIPFGEHTGAGKKGAHMLGMLEHFGLPLVGRHHSGIDDARNIAAVAKALVEADADVRETGRSEKW